MELLDQRSSSSSKGSGGMEYDMHFPPKPKSKDLGKPVGLISNFYKFNIDVGGREVLFEYIVKTAPALSCHTNEEKMKMMKIIKKMREKLEAQFDHHVYWEGFIYSFEKIDELEALEGVEIEEDEVPYIVSIALHNVLEFTDTKVTRFFRAYMNQLIKKSKLRLTRAGKHFDPRDPVELEGVSMYSAYWNTMKCISNSAGSSIYLNLNPSVKFFQQEPILYKIQSIGSERRVKDELTGRSVMTIYNNRVYRIDEIVFEKTPNDKFQCDMHHKQKETTYADYVFENYKMKVSEPDQPLLKHHNPRTGQDIFLIPEFCVLTGITDEQKGRNFRAIKDQMFANAATKAKQAEKFFMTLKKNKKDYTEFTKKWKIQVEEEQLKVKGYLCKQGTVIGNRDKTFNLKDMKRDFSREFTGPLRSSKIQSWAILYSKFSSREFDTFMKQLKQTVTTDFEYKCNKPLTIQLKGDDRKADTWINTISSLSRDETLDIIICIAPGRKGSSPIYDDLKYFLQTDCPIPSQVILSETIKKNFKSLRNIVKNLMMQMCAKMGHIPWGYSNLPLMDVPTMVIGIDVCHRVGRNKKSVLAFVASLDKYVGKYYSACQSQGEKQEIAFSIEKLFQEAIIQFIEVNKSPPQRIIVYRDAVSEGQSETTIQTEVPQLSRAIDNLYDAGTIESKPKVLFILANKRIEQRFCTADRGKLYNPNRGIVIEDTITRQDRFEFYMISHSGPTGLQCPIRYEVIHSTWDDLNPKDLYDLTNILCSGYFNLAGVVKIPGPIMYAHTMCNQISKICNRKDKIVDTPAEFSKKLYYI